jgi:hypothetical protein
VQHSGYTGVGGGRGERLGRLDPSLRIRVTRHREQHVDRWCSADAAERLDGVVPDMRVGVLDQA